MENTDRRLQQVQQTVDEVTVIMHENLDRVEERGEKMQDLDKRAELLRSKSQKFSKTAVKVKRRKWWQNKKMKLLLGAVILVVVVVLIIIIAMASKGNASNPDAVQPDAETTVAQKQDKDCGVLFV
ncbi:hypothetical protein GJAV_G00043350 [Gymnothorax javanicus]|nr:hypothetical protein GJAV_G00043350 [Gymnothorax javanicus]